MQQRIRVFPPERITDELMGFCKQVCPHAVPFFAQVSDKDGTSNPASPQTDGNNAVHGWSIWQWGAAMLEFESYVVIHQPGGHWVDVETKGTVPRSRILFLPDTHAPAARTTHTRFPLSDSPCVSQYIALAAQRDALVRHALSTCRLTKQELRALSDYEARLDALLELFPRIKETDMQLYLSQ